MCPGSGVWFAWRDNRPTRMLVEYIVAHLRGGCGSQPGGLRLPAQPPRRCRTRRHLQRRRPLRLLRCPQRCRCQEQTPCVGALCPSVAVLAPHGCLPRLPESAPCQRCLLETRCRTSKTPNDMVHCDLHTVERCCDTAASTTHTCSRLLKAISSQRAAATHRPAPAPQKPPPPPARPTTGCSPARALPPSAPAPRPLSTRRRRCESPAGC